MSDLDSNSDGVTFCHDANAVDVHSFKAQIYFLTIVLH